MHRISALTISALLGLAATAGVALGQQTTTRAAIDTAAQNTLTDATDAVANEPAAAADAEDWVRREPANASAWMAAGDTRPRNGQLQDAVSAYRQALQLEPKHVAAWVRLGIVHDQPEQPEKPIEAYRQG